MKLSSEEILDELKKAIKEHKKREKPLLDKIEAEEERYRKDTSSICEALVEALEYEQAGEKAKAYRKLNDGTCPVCGAPLRVVMSGVDCTNCDYWFCF